MVVEDTIAVLRVTGMIKKRIEGRNHPDRKKKGLDKNGKYYYLQCIHTFIDDIATLNAHHIPACTYTLYVYYIYIYTFIYHNMLWRYTYCIYEEA